MRRYTTALADWAQDLVAAALGEASGVDCHARVGMPVGPLRLVGLPGRLATGHLEANAHARPDAGRGRHRDRLHRFGGLGYLRLSAHAYNTPEDYLDLVERAVPLLLAWAVEADPASAPVTVNPQGRREQ